MADLDWGAAVDNQECSLVSQVKNLDIKTPENKAVSSATASTTNNKTTEPDPAVSKTTAPTQTGSGDSPATNSTDTAVLDNNNSSKTDAVDTGKEEPMSKLVRSKLITSVHADLEILQADPNSPLFSVKSFEALNLKKELLQGLYDMKFNAPSKIQETALPSLLADPPVNMIAQSQSGTGKTAAFVLTMLSRVDTNKPYPQCLCLAPTYELALQIGENIEQMSKHMTNFTLVYAVRGERVARGQKVQGHIIIGTPGTVADWSLKFKSFDLKKIDVFCLDEADVMIATQGHQDQSIRIQRGLRKDCQMLLFSATYDDDVMRFAQAVIPNNPVVIKLRREEQSLDNIKQFYIECTDKESKFQALSNIYGSISIGQSMIFCATRNTAHWLSEKMTKDGHAVGLLSGDLEIAQRAAIINRFKDGKEKVLITTNVTSRGIDVEQVTVVVNFDLPLTQDMKPDNETYLHRIGRTGRFGKNGIAINLIDNSRSYSTLRAIEKFFGRSIVKLDAEDIDEIEKIGT
ncbi:ATP-dependent RNA helicase DDX19A-like isoform X2 [Mizuhopecten yessoensis]|uniref:ATP-dependent RNA helicase DDX19A-like isoform X2 n=1 Tax=Mizuhopecten yessoensis TaxID=6573 RepID=UPI000B45E359|nr:ATP-dependent RNA helicase DDX19A-like isoform X2 [Mizuhopecten yessoensis]